MKSRQIMARRLLSLALITSGPAIAADGSQCINIADSAARLSCYDAALKSHPSVSAAPSTQSTAKTAKPATPVAEGAVTPQEAFGIPPKLTTQEAALKRLKATVVALKDVPVGQVMTLDNGQVWQIPGYLPEPFVKVHDAVVIKRGTVGSYLMVRASGGDSVRVKRLE